MPYAHGPLRVKDTMTAIAAALEEVRAVKKAWPYPKWGADVGEAVVGYPETIDVGVTMGESGSDEATFPVWILAGLINEETTPAVIDAYIASVVPALESGDHGQLDQVIGSLRVASIGIDPLVTEGGLRYALLSFQCEVVS